jgi:hypothetical protein
VSRPSSYGFEIRCRERLRFVRSGGGAEPLEVVVAEEPRQRPAHAPLADWVLAGADPPARASLYRVDGGFQFWATDAGAYHIDFEAGWIEMPRSDDEILREQRLWGVPTALCFLHRGDIPLHAAAVQVGGGAVILAAPTRHGKTTLALAFQQHGYRVLSEDLACCRLDGVPSLLPGPALLRVRPDVYGGAPAPGTRVAAVRPDRVYLVLDDDHKGTSAPVPIQAIVLLRESAEGITITPVASRAALPDLWALSFRPPTDAACARAFTQLARLAGSIPIWNLSRPLRLDALEPTVAAIVSLCRS